MSPMRVTLHPIAMLALSAVLSFGALCVGTVTSTLAQRSGQPLPEAFNDAGLDEQLGERVPQDVTFYNEAGEEVALGDYFQADRPVILNFVYHNCPMLCNLVLDGFTKALQGMEWTPGEQFEVVTVSFAADETPDLAARQKALYLKSLGRPEAAAGWHFLTGEEASIQRLAQSVGFEFRWDEQAQQYAHPATLVFLSPEGKVTRYLYGLDYPPRDVRTALVEASNGTVGTTLDRLILYCFQYDPAANSYVLHAQNAMKLGGLLTVLVLGTGLFLLWRRERFRTGEPALPEMS